MSTDDSQREYRCVEPFDIDDGELDGLSPALAFVLGCEWWQVKEMLETGAAFGKPIHNENANRIKRMCIRRDRRFKMRDNGPEWKWIDVEVQQ